MSIKSLLAIQVDSLNYLDISISQFYRFKAFKRRTFDICDPKTFLCVLGNLVLDDNGIPVEDHKYVFSPEVVQRKVKFNIFSLSPYYVSV